MTERRGSTRRRTARRPSDRRATSALAVPAYRRLWSAGLVSDSGDWLLFIALPLVVLQLTGSALGTALALLLELVPPVLLAPVVARLVDRVDRRTLMVVVNLLQAVALVPLLLVRTADDLPLVFLVIAVQSVCSSVFEPAKNAMLPGLVGPGRIVSANALGGLNQDLGRLVGGPLGGVLLLAGGLPLVAAVDAVTYLLSAALVLSLPRGAKGRGRPVRTPGARSTSGIVTAIRDRGVRAWLLPFAVSSVAQGMFVILFILFVTEVLAAGEVEVGLLRGIQAVGAIAAGLVIAFAAARWRPRTLLLVGAVSFGLLSLTIWNLPLLLASLGGGRGLLPFVVLFALVGAPGVLLVSGLLSGLQFAATDENRGSVFTALGVASAVGQGVGILAAGLLATVVGVIPLLEVQGALYLATAAVAFLTLPRTSGVPAGTPATMPAPTPASTPAPTP